MSEISYQAKRLQYSLNNLIHSYLSVRRYQGRRNACCRRNRSTCVRLIPHRRTTCCVTKGQPCLRRLAACFDHVPWVAIVVLEYLVPRERDRLKHTLINRQLVKTHFHHLIANNPMFKYTNIVNWYTVILVQYHGAFLWDDPLWMDYRSFLGSFEAPGSMWSSIIVPVLETHPY